jgi:uncharacterized protein
MCYKKCGGHKLSWALVIVGALNWGLIGAFGVNVVNTLLGAWSWAERTVYVLVGLAAVMMLLKKKCKMCMGGMNGGMCSHDQGCTCKDCDRCK